MSKGDDARERNPDHRIAYGRVDLGHRRFRLGHTCTLGGYALGPSPTLQDLKPLPGLVHPRLSHIEGREGFVQHFLADPPAIEKSPGPVPVSESIVSPLFSLTQSCPPLLDLLQAKPAFHLSQQSPGRILLGLGRPTPGQ